MTILLFHTLKEALGQSEIPLPIGKPIASNELWELLVHKHPQLKPYRKHTRMACNQSYVTEETLIYPGDEVALIPPVSGG
jgi:molybdopterin converting factor subunit 1